MRKMKGTGLPNVFLIDGVVEHPDGAMAYRDLDGLYVALAGAIASRVTPLTPAELRFLRKRLNMTQDAVGALGGKGGQMAAKWEKGTAAVPLAEGNLLRLIWLARNTRRMRALADAVSAIADGNGQATPCPYVLRHVDGAGWSEDIEAAREMAREEALAHTQAVIARAMAGQPVEHHYTTEDVALDIVLGSATVVAGASKELFT